MTTLIPPRFLVRLAHPCLYFKAMPGKAGKALLDLPDSAILQTYSELNEFEPFGTVRVAWNELGMGIQVDVTGKKKPLECDADRPRSGDGLALWIDTRDSRTSHRASRYCHQFHLLPRGGGPDKDDPTFGQTKINRAQQDAPLCNPNDVPFRVAEIKGGYRIECFLSAAVLTGFDPEQHPRLGIAYQLRDSELGDQYSCAGGDFPLSDDPSLWDVLVLGNEK